MALKRHRFGAALIAAGIVFPLLSWAGGFLFPDEAVLEIDLKFIIGFGLLCLLAGLGLIWSDVRKRKKGA